MRRTMMSSFLIPFKMSLLQTFNLFCISTVFEVLTWSMVSGCWQRLALHLKSILSISSPSYVGWVDPLVDKSRSSEPDSDRGRANLSPTSSLFKHSILWKNRPVKFRGEGKMVQIVINSWFTLLHYSHRQKFEVKPALLYWKKHYKFLMRRHFYQQRSG